MNKYILLLTLVMVTGCSQSIDYKYHPLKNVGINVYVAKIEVKEGGQTFIQFKYEILNNSDSPVKLNTKNIRIIVNGEQSKFVHHNNLASTQDTDLQLKKGPSEHQFYLMVNKVFENKEIKEFKVIDFGLE